MVKGDAVTKEKNKARRKKMQKEDSNVSARLASIIATKKRRLSGKRRMCQVSKRRELVHCFLKYIWVLLISFWD